LLLYQGFFRPPLTASGTGRNEPDNSSTADR
jgi:hypothetical protein